MIFVRTAKFFFILLIGSVAQAQLLSTYVREQAGTLPKGRFMLSMVQVNASVDRVFGRDGVRESLSGNFKQGVTYQKIANEEPVRGAQLSGLFLSNGLTMDDSAGEVTGSLLGTVNAKVPVIGYGITDDMGLYISVPILKFQIQSQYQFQSSPQTKEFLDRLRSDDQVSVAREFDAALSTSLENKLHRTGYAWDPNLNRTYLGDIQVMVMKVWDTGSMDHPEKMVLQPIMVLPTATDQDIRDLYGLRAGDKRFGLGLKYSYQRAIDSRLQFNAATSGTVLFASTQSKRLPIASDDDLNEVFDPNTQVSGGSRWLVQTQLRYQFPRWLGLNVGMSWQRKLSESYQGSAFDPSLYAMASAKSDAELLSSYASLDLNSIPSFLEGNFLIPVIAELGIGIPIRGRNAVAEPVIQLQGSTFF